MPVSSLNLQTSPEHSNECAMSLFIIRGFSPQPGTDVSNPALVADGTRCGSGRVRH